MADPKTLKQASESFTKFVHDKGFEAIFFEGVSSHTARIAFLITWKRLYPKKPFPTIFSIGDTSLFLDSIEKNQFKLTLKWQKLLQRKVLVANEQSYTGGKLVKMKNALESLGFGRVSTGTLSHTLSTPNQLKELREKLYYVGPSLPASEVFYSRRKFLIEQISRRRKPRDGMKEIRASRKKRQNFLRGMDEIRKSVKARLK